jgi:hypothetical protein
MEITKVLIEEGSDGLLLRQLLPFPPTRLEDVVGCLPYRGNQKRCGKCGMR